MLYSHEEMHDAIKHLSIQKKLVGKRDIFFRFFFFFFYERKIHALEISELVVR